MAGPDASHLYQALAAEVGIICRSDDPHHDRQRLYQIRSDLKDPDLDCLSVQISPSNPSEELWIVKRSKDATQGDVPLTEGDLEPS